MKTNSTAKIYTDLIFPKIEGSWTPYPRIFLYPQVNENVEPNSITILAEPKSFSVNQHNVNVTYTIITKNSTKGIFEIFTGSWGYSYPLVVGLNESEVNATIFYNFQPISCIYCPAFTTDPPSEKVVGYSSLVVKTFSENSSMWENPTQISTTVPEFPFTAIVFVLSIVSTILLYQFGSKIKN
jgi:hypothetical protein